MCFVCSGYCRDSFKLLYELIAEKNDKFFFYETGLALLNNLSLCPKAKTLLILEYDLYKGFSDFIYDFLRMKDWKIPLLLIGNPIFPEKCRAENWICENEFQYDIQNLHLMYPLLKKISIALENDRIKKAFAFRDLNRPEKLQKSEILSEKNHEILKIENKILTTIEQLKGSHNFPPTVFNILDYFYTNRLREVSLEEIENVLHIASDSEKNRKNAAYSYISRLRKCLDTCVSCMFRLIRTRKGFYQLVPK